MDIAAIDLNGLPALPLGERSGLPDAPAVYFAMAADGAVLYIGKARRLSKRWKSTIHHRYTQLSAIGGVRLAWLVVSDESLLNGVERACVEYFNPALNRTELPHIAGSRSKYTFRLSDALMDDLERIAREESRSTTAQMEVFLWESIRQYEQETA